MKRVRDIPVLFFLAVDWWNRNPYAGTDEYWSRTSYTNESKACMSSWSMGVTPELRLALGGCGVHMRRAAVTSAMSSRMVVRSTPVRPGAWELHRKLKYTEYILLR